LIDTLSDLTLEGLPTDEEVGARRFRLDDLFVPLNLVPPELETGPSEERFDEGGNTIIFDSMVGEEVVSGSVTVGRALQSYPRLALTGGPGAGKTTLLKHLALSYARARIGSEAVPTHLPERELWPVLLQCRSIADPRQPLQEILKGVPARAEMNEIAEAFGAAVSVLLREGRMLLLVDGLDEIADDGARTAFVRQLRTLIATYPSVTLIVTSRPRGFRAVANVLATACKRFNIADLSDHDIRALTANWHLTVVGQSEQVQRDAADLAEGIIQTDRVRALATNPLLLTTLLLVRRWVGELPRKRAILYGKAIEVLHDLECGSA